MFDISWSELLILGIVTLVFVGPKELPVFLRTIGKYVGMIKRQAGEFREQFDTAMREAEFQQIRKDVMNVKTDVESTVRDAGRSVESEFDAMSKEFDNLKVDTAPAPDAPDPDAHDANGIPLSKPDPVSATEPAAPVSSAKAAAEAAAQAARDSASAPAASAQQTAAAMKSGV